MNIQSLYEYVILRDILAYILPGGISLVGIALIAQSFGIDRWNKVIFSLIDLSSWAFIIALIMIAFLVGHIIDMLYRILLQNSDWYRRPQTVRKMLTGYENPAARFKNDAISTGIRKAIGVFFDVDWTKTTIEDWISSGKAIEGTTILCYWIEQANSRLFNSEIGRPLIQAHFLHSSGFALGFFGLCLVTIEVMRSIGWAVTPTGEPGANIITAVVVWLFGFSLIRQGGHKREITVEHTYRVFYMLWRNRQCFGNKSKDSLKTDNLPEKSEFSTDDLLG